MFALVLIHGRKILMYGGKKFFSAAEQLSIDLSPVNATHQESPYTHRVISHPFMPFHCCHHFHFLV